MQFALLGRTRSGQGLAQVAPPRPPVSSSSSSLARSQRTFGFVNCASGFHYFPKASQRYKKELHTLAISKQQQQQQQQQATLLQPTYKFERLRKSTTSQSRPWSSQWNTSCTSNSFRELDDKPVSVRYFATSSSNASNGSKFNLDGATVMHYLVKLKDFFVNVGKGIAQLYRNTKQANLIREKERAGQPLTRKEYRFLRQNRRDLITVVPIVLLTKIPILGKLVLLTLVMRFPWVLPSTFGFLRPPVPLRKRLEDAELYKKFVLPNLPKTPELAITKPVQYPLTPASAKDLAQYYSKELDIDRLNNAQLSSLCMAVDKSGWGLGFMLKDRLASHLGVISIEDQMLAKEGLEGMNEDELEEACKERGLFTELDENKLRSQLAAWIQLSKEDKDTLLNLLTYHHAFAKVPLWLSNNGNHKNHANTAQ